MTIKTGVLLSGCGVFDGSEIHEAVLTLLFLDQAGAEIICMAPDIDQLHVINHATTEKTNEKRNVLVESARIARGEIKNLKDIKTSDLDALILPGGFGAAKNLCNFAIKGSDATVNSEVKRILNEMLTAKKPIGAICIAPALITSALSKINPEVTIGTDKETAAAIENMGGKHIKCNVNEIHIDKKNKIITTPAYMCGPGIKDVAQGIEKLVKKVLELA
ncbi:MAG: isoprenoid biosynthesis protein ElbB [Desulfobacteraceae bacterium 4572_130]|nr:MAG: isoprenoid biosynthesis protein ElbB [Desulfobacteraceae bacterium 4572_130]